MAVVASWDGATRRIYLAQGTAGVVSFNPCADVYPEYREERRTNESFRRWFPFVRAVGNEPKGGGKYTPRYLLLLDDGDIGQTKIIPFDEDSVINVTGELLTEDQTSPFDLSTLSAGTNVVINYAPPTSEIIQLGVSGLTQDESDKLDEIHGWSYLAHLWNKVALFGKKITRKAADPLVDPGTLEVYDPDTDALFASGDAYEDEDGNIGYRGRGLDRQDKLS